MYVKYNSYHKIWHSSSRSSCPPRIRPCLDDNPQNTTQPTGHYWKNRNSSKSHDPLILAAQVNIPPYNVSFCKAGSNCRSYWRYWNSSQYLHPDFPSSLRQSNFSKFLPMLIQYLKFKNYFINFKILILIDKIYKKIQIILYHVKKPTFISFLSINRDYRLAQRAWQDMK